MSVSSVLFSADSVRPVRLLCEDEPAPLGVRELHPRLSWQIASDRPGVRQTAYQIEVRDVWDSGRVASSRSVAIPYGGPALEAGQRYEWRVRVWTGEDEISPWSDPAFWTMGKLEEKDWAARWITVAGEGASGPAAPWFRKDFDLASAPESALVTVHSPGFFELYVNGVKAGDDVLSPPAADPRARTFAVTYDVRSLLRPGRNCLGIWTSKGWAESIVFRAQLDAVVDGKPFVVGTGPDWQSRPSGRSHIGGWTWNDFGGERVDAAADLRDWSAPGQEISGWQAAVEGAAPKGPLCRRSAPLNRLGERLPVKEVTALGGGRFELDFGTNLTGWLEMKLPLLRPGQVVRFHFADRVMPDGVQSSPIGNVPVNRGSCIEIPRADGGKNLYQTFHQTSEFVSAGKEGEMFRHKFNFAGFRYVVVEGLDEAPRAEDATAQLVESDLRDAGSFECADPLINRIHSVNRWTLRCLNLGAYIVDCPHRERMGYGDGQVSLEGMMMNFGAARFYEKWGADWMLAQDPASGAMPNIAPPFTAGGGGPPWAGVSILLPWQHYLHYGDSSILENHFDAAWKYAAYLDARTENDILRAWGKGFEFLGDWVPPGRGMDTENWPTREMAELFCNAYRVYLWQLLEKMARVLGRTQEEQTARKRVAALRPAVHAAFFDPVKKRYVADEQIYYAMPLLTGVTPPEERAAVLANLEKCLVGKNKGRLDTGMLGTRFLLEYLAAEGRHDLILPIYQTREYPGWGYMVDQGATTLWEQWNGYWSQIHSCFASADTWLYHHLAGIRPDPEVPGFQRVRIQPAVDCGLEWVRAGHESPYGKIRVAWKREGRNVEVKVSLPPNTSARLDLPGREGEELESGEHVIRHEIE